MYILAQTEPLENNRTNEYRVIAGEIGRSYRDSGYTEYERVYKLRVQHKEYAVICPEYRKTKRGIEPIVIIPEFLVPRRPYPLYVYLHGIDLYSNSPEKGQRWAAEETRKRFGLESFSHTTLGRAMKVFLRLMDEEGAGVTDGDTTESPGNCRAAGFPTVKLTMRARKMAARFLRGISPWAQKIQAVTDCQAIARRRFAEYQRFLL